MITTTPTIDPGALSLAREADIAVSVADAARREGRPVAADAALRALVELGVANRFGHLAAAAANAPLTAGRAREAAKAAAKSDRRVGSAVGSLLDVEG